MIIIFTLNIFKLHLIFISVAFNNKFNTRELFTNQKIIVTNIMMQYQ